MKLRPYQEKMIEDTRQALRKHSRVLLQGPTGCGKTAITVYMMGRATEQGKKAWFLVHQNELLNQTSRALWRQKLEHGIICSGKVKTNASAQVASVQTLARRLDLYDEPDLIIIDECHRSASATYRKILDRYPNAKVIGLTATPSRTDKKGLNDTYGDMVLGPTIRQLINAGFLCDYRIYAPNTIAIEGVKTRAGDYAKDELESAVDKPTITGDAVQHYKKLALGKKCVVMCVTINHAKHVAESYIAAGIKAACIEGSMSPAEREKVLNQFANGDIDVITNVQLLIEGIDIPRVEVIQWLRHTQSIIVYMQGNGRGLRPYEGKESLLILDHVGNTMRHGLPCDDRTWSLEGRTKGKSKKSDDEPDLNVQQCGKCYGVFRSGVDTCPYCGSPVEGRERVIREQEGELQQVDIDAVRREQRREQGVSRSLRDLVALGVRKGMKRPDAWAANVFAAREKRKPSKDDFNNARNELRSIKVEQRNQANASNNDSFI